MALTTPILGIQYPQLGDSPNAPANFATVATALDNKLIPRFASSAARDAAIPSPIVGQVVMRVDSATSQFLQIYRRGAWDLVKMSEYAYKTADTTRVSTTTRTADPDLQFTAAPGSTYVGQAFITYSCPVDTVDLSLRMTIPGTFTLNEFVHHIPTSATTSSGVQMFSLAQSGPNTLTPGAMANAVSFVQHFRLIATTGGLVSYDWAQQNLSANGLTLHAGSYLKYTRIA